MAQVAIILNDRTYQIACDDGQEDHVKSLAAMVDTRMKDLAGSVGQVGDLRLLVMASLLIADEVLELEEQVEEASKGASKQSSNAENSVREAAIGKLADGLETVAARMQSIAEAPQAP